MKPINTRQIIRVDRRTTSVEAYFQSIGKFPLLSIEREIELATQIQKGDKDALSELIKANLRFVVSVAKQFRQDDALLDLIQEGNKGLAEAAQRFDHTKGFKFISYAVWWIRQAIMKYLSDTETIVYLPANVVRNRITAYKAADKILAATGEEVSLTEAALEVGIPTFGIELAYNARSPVRMDAPIGDDDSATKGDFIGAKPDDEASELCTFLRAKLTAEDYYLIALRYGLDGHDEKTQPQIANIFGKTAAWVSWQERRILRNLKNTQIRKYL